MVRFAAEAVRTICSRNACAGPVNSCGGRISTAHSVPAGMPGGEKVTMPGAESPRRRQPSGKSKIRPIGACGTSSTVATSAITNLLMEHLPAIGRRERAPNVACRSTRQIAADGVSPYPRGVATILRFTTRLAASSATSSVSRRVGEPFSDRNCCT